MGPCAYDFVEEPLHDFGWRNMIGREFRALTNRLFAVHHPAHVRLDDVDLKPEYYISEHHLQKHAQAWVKVLRWVLPRGVCRFRFRGVSVHTLGFQKLMRANDL